MPGWFDLTGVQAGDQIPYFSVDPSKSWTASAAEIALAARFSARDAAGKLVFAPLAQNTYPLAETDPTFSPDNLQLESVNRLINDLTVLGQLEPAAHVKDYFVGDGFTTTFYMSQIPFTRSNQIPIYNRTILNEEYTELDPTHWTAIDPTNAFSVTNGQLQVSGGNGLDGQTCLEFVEQMELGGATVLEHGEVVFNAASTGVIGGLYTGAIAIANCVAGFRITPSGIDSSIQALVGGVLTGTPLVTQAGHHYVFTTYLYPTEIYRMQQVFHSSLHPSGSARGGAAVACDVRVVMQVQDIDPANPATQVAAATVLYDGVISSAPGFCTYALINAATMQCSVAFTYIFLAIDAVVRTTLPGENPVTAQAGTLISGAECRVSDSPTLEFYPEYIPPANEAIEVTYRSSGHAAARVVNSASIAAHQNGADNGVRGSVRQIAIPVPRTSAMATCANASRSRHKSSHCGSDGTAVAMAESSHWSVPHWWNSVATRSGSAHCRNGSTTMIRALARAATVTNDPSARESQGAPSITMHSGGGGSVRTMASAAAIVPSNRLPDSGSARTGQPNRSASALTRAGSALCDHGPPAMISPRPSKGSGPLCVAVSVPPPETGTNTFGPRRAGSGAASRPLARSRRWPFTRSRPTVRMSTFLPL